MNQHQYTTQTEWTGNLGSGTESYDSYERNHIIRIKDKYADILASSDSNFRGDKSLYNPEELFLASLSSCHMLWYLHLCANKKINIIEYIDNAIGTMTVDRLGKGKFTEVVLNPTVKIENKDQEQEAIDLHHKANKMCFIANSCNFRIKHSVKIIT